jgi:peptidoglycan-associated lipoprotein
MLEKGDMHRTLVVMLMAASLALGACKTQRPKPTTPPPPAEATTGAEASGANAANAAGANTSEDEVAGPQAGMLAKRVIYFDFDSAEIRGEGTDIVAAHAKYLAGNPNARIRLEGHTDERGSREYNIGLGERRAQSVRRALLLQGAADGELSTVSYGEERPAVAGHDETAWTKNRRVEIVYLTPNNQPAQPPK